MDDAEFAVTGFGTAGRVALSAVRAARDEGIKVGLIRPIILNPFPEKIYAEISKNVEGILVVEMNTGQMLDDVRLAVKEQTPVEFYGRIGGVIPMTDEILDEIHHLVKGPLSTEGDPRQRWLARLEQVIG